MTSTSVSGYTTKSGKKVSGYTQNRKTAAAPKHRASRKTRRVLGGGIASASAADFVASGFNFGSSIFRLGTAIVTVATLLVLGSWAQRTVQKRRPQSRSSGSRKKPTAKKKTNQLGLPKAPSLREFLFGKSSETKKDWSAGMSEDTTPKPKRASRTWDGSPETAAEKRFFDLRESGYKGWIDQDGYPVDVPPLKT